MSLRQDLYLQRQKLKRQWDRFKYGNCTVLLYHRIVETDFDPQQLCVSPKNFKAQLTYLKKNYKFLTIEQFNDHLLNKKPFPKNSLVISFDDGYADNLKNAIPILEELNLQALFYIATKNLNTSLLFWWDELDLLFRWEEKMDKTILSELLKASDTKNTKELYEHYLNMLKRSHDMRQRDAHLNSIRELRSINEAEKEQYVCLTFNELKQLAASSSAVIGAHTVEHLSLWCLNEDEQRKEINDSVSKLKELLNMPVDYFAYPYGEKRDYNEKTMKICEELNLKHAAANFGGYMNSESDRYAFTRHVVRNDSPEIVEKKIKELL
ncbi:MAG: polysaccharide deacetylase family protein [Bacteroidia bacterium]|nr:polysaccharide deacetylase family protein [Bacteroidia bacterium]